MRSHVGESYGELGAMKPVYVALPVKRPAEPTAT